MANIRRARSNPFDPPSYVGTAIPPASSIGATTAMVFSETPPLTQRPSISIPAQDISYSYSMEDASMAALQEYMANNPPRISNPMEEHIRRNQHTQDRLDTATNNFSGRNTNRFFDYQSASVNLLSSITPELSLSVEGKFLIVKLTLKDKNGVTLIADASIATDEIIDAY